MLDFSSLSASTSGPHTNAAKPPPPPINTSFSWSSSALAGVLPSSSVSDRIPIDALTRVTAEKPGVQEPTPTGSREATPSPSRPPPIAALRSSGVPLRPGRPPRLPAEVFQGGGGGGGGTGGSVGGLRSLRTGGMYGNDSAPERLSGGGGGGVQTTLFPPSPPSTSSSFPLMRMGAVAPSVFSSSGYDTASSSFSSSSFSSSPFRVPNPTMHTRGGDGGRVSRAERLAVLAEAIPHARTIWAAAEQKSHQTTISVAFVGFCPSTLHTWRSLLQHAAAEEAGSGGFHVEALLYGVDEAAYYQDATAALSSMANGDGGGGGGGGTAPFRLHPPSPSSSSSSSFFSGNNARRPTSRGRGGRGGTGSERWSNVGEKPWETARSRQWASSSSSSSSSRGGAPPPPFGFSPLHPSCAASARWRRSGQTQRHATAASAFVAWCATTLRPPPPPSPMPSSSWRGEKAAAEEGGGGWASRTGGSGHAIPHPPSSSASVSFASSMQGGGPPPPPPPPSPCGVAVVSIEDFFHHPALADLRARVDVLLVQDDPVLLAAMNTHHRLSFLSRRGATSTDTSQRIPSVMERVLAHAVVLHLHVVLSPEMSQTLSLEEWKPWMEAVLQRFRVSSSTPTEGPDHHRMAEAEEETKRKKSPTSGGGGEDPARRSPSPLASPFFSSPLLPPLCSSCEAPSASGSSSSPPAVLFLPSSMGQWCVPHVKEEWPNRIGAPFLSPVSSSHSSSSPPPSVFPPSSVSAIGKLQRLQLVLMVPAPTIDDGPPHRIRWDASTDEEEEEEEEKEERRPQGRSALWRKENDTNRKSGVLLTTPALPLASSSFSSSSSAVVAASGEGSPTAEAFTGAALLFGALPPPPPPPPSSSSSSSRTRPTVGSSPTFLVPPSGFPPSSPTDGGAGRASRATDPSSPSPSSSFFSLSSLDNDRLLRSSFLPLQAEKPSPSREMPAKEEEEAVGPEDWKEWVVQVKRGGVEEPVPPRPQRRERRTPHPSNHPTPPHSRLLLQEARPHEKKKKEEVEEENIESRLLAVYDAQMARQYQEEWCRLLQERQATSSMSGETTTTATTTTTTPAALQDRPDVPLSLLSGTMEGERSGHEEEVKAPPPPPAASSSSSLDVDSPVYHIERIDRDDMNEAHTHKKKKDGPTSSSRLLLQWREAYRQQRWHPAPFPRFRLTFSPFFTFPSSSSSSSLVSCDHRRNSAESPPLLQCPPSLCTVRHLQRVPADVFRVLVRPAVEMLLASLRWATPYAVMASIRELDPRTGAAWTISGELLFATFAAVPKGEEAGPKAPPQNAPPQPLPAHFFISCAPTAPLSQCLSAFGSSGVLEMPTPWLPSSKDQYTTPEPKGEEEDDDPKEEKKNKKKHGTRGMHTGRVLFSPRWTLLSWERCRGVRRCARRRRRTTTTAQENPSPLSTKLHTPFQRTPIASPHARPTSHSSHHAPSTSPTASFSSSSFSSSSSNASSLLDEAWGLRIQRPAHGQRRSTREAAPPSNPSRHPNDSTVWLKDESRLGEDHLDGVAVEKTLQLPADEPGLSYTWTVLRQALHTHEAAAARQSCLALEEEEQYWETVEDGTRRETETEDHPEEEMAARRGGRFPPTVKDGFARVGWEKRWGEEEDVFSSFASSRQWTPTGVQDEASSTRARYPFAPFDGAAAGPSARPSPLLSTTPTALSASPPRFVVRDAREGKEWCQRAWLVEQVMQSIWESCLLASASSMPSIAGVWPKQKRKEKAHAKRKEKERKERERKKTKNTTTTIVAHARQKNVSRGEGRRTT